MHGKEKIKGEENGKGKVKGNESGWQEGEGGLREEYA